MNSIFSLKSRTRLAAIQVLEHGLDPPRQGPGHVLWRNPRHRVEPTSVRDQRDLPPGGPTYTVSDGIDGEDGEDGTSCSVTDNQDGTATIACTDGTSYTVSNGQDGQDGGSGEEGTRGSDADPCTVTGHDDGSSTITCPDGTSVLIPGPGTVASRGCSQSGHAPGAALTLIAMGLLRRRRRSTRVR